jgi:hypothetical protein
MLIVLEIVGAVICYSFAGTTTGMMLHKKLEVTDLDDWDRGAWSIVFGIVWPLVGPALTIWHLANRTVRALETRQEKKRLPVATVESE